MSQESDLWNNWINYQRILSWLIGNLKLEERVILDLSKNDQQTFRLQSVEGL